MPLRIIAEVGSNWKRETPKQSKEAALEHIRQAALAGATGVKFQLFRADTLYSKERAPEQYEAVKQYELPIEWLPNLGTECKRCGVDFWITPFAPDLVDPCLSIVDGLKIASGDITCFDLLEEVSLQAHKWRLPVMLSTGGATKEEVDKALTIFRKRGVHITLLYCVSNYPAGVNDYNLTVFPYSDYANETGISDHTPGNRLIFGGVTLGYTTFEKHFHIDSTPNDLPDRSVSINPPSFARYSHLINKKFTKRYRSDFANRGDSDERVWARRGKDGLRPSVD